MSPRSKPIRPQRPSYARTHQQRQALLAQGLIPIEIWTYDLTPEFLAKIKAQSEALRDSPEEREVMDELEQMQIEDGLWD